MPCSFKNLAQNVLGLAGSKHMASSYSASAALAQPDDIFDSEASYGDEAEKLVADGVLPAEAAEPMDAAGRAILKVLSDVFGYHGFLGDQEQIMRHVCAGNDALVLMPTGGGKSLCYQVPGLVRPGLGIVISPLIALMYDQVARLRENGVEAALINSDVSPAENARTLQACRDGRIKFLYVAPERFVLDQFQNAIRGIPLSVLAIDEAHCVSQWGHNFRPEYRLIGDVCARIEGVPRIAVTATAAPVTRADMKKNLHLEDARTFVSSFDRPNISYTIVDRADQNKQLIEFLSGHRNESGVIYCLSRDKTEKTAALLRKHGFDAIHYHAGMDKEDKAINQERFSKGEGVVACATIAFGMGIDKPDVRFVAHLDLPESLEAYYQETGRAGRDRLPAVAWMSCGGGDLKFRRDNIESSAVKAENPEEYRRLAWGRLNALVAMVQSPGCRRASVLRYFGEEHSGRCGSCDRCLHPVVTFDGTREAQMILSAAKRTGQRFGGGYLVDIVTGTTTDRNARNGHTALPTFGVGKDRSKDWWTHVVRQLTAADLLYAPADAEGGLVITETGAAVLGSKQTMMLVDPQKRALRSDRSSANGRFNLADGLPPERQQVYDALKRLRSQIARSKGVPAYAIFPDVTLIGLVSRMPENLGQMAHVSGIGERKLKSYGALILEAMAPYRKPTHRPEQIMVPGMGRSR